MPLPVDGNGAAWDEADVEMPEPEPAASPPGRTAPEPAMREPQPLDPVHTPEHAVIAERREPREAREPRDARESHERREPHERRSPRPSRHREDRDSSAPDMTPDELAAASRKLTEELLTHMGFEPRVSVRAEGNRVDVTVEVDRDEQLLNGRQGETRQALQHLLNRFLNKGDGSRYHLQLEVNDLWQQRAVELEALAKQLADQAVSTNSEVVSDYLNSQERRILHVTLKEDTRVRTFSLGDGLVKRVAVAPAGFPDRTGAES